VAIHRLLQGPVFDDHTVKAMTTAYDAALVDLGLLNRTERLKEMRATAVDAVAKQTTAQPGHDCAPAATEEIHNEARKK